MGFTPHPEDERFLTNKNVFGKGVIDTEECMAYHTSWDWLVPVLIKIERECQGVPPQLLDVGFYVEIDEVYQAVVEFIKAYNDE